MDASAIWFFILGFFVIGAILQRLLGRRANSDSRGDDFKSRQRNTQAPAQEVQPFMDQNWRNMDQ